MNIAAPLVPCPVCAGVLPRVSNCTVCNGTGLINAYVSTRRPPSITASMPQEFFLSGTFDGELRIKLSDEQLATLVNRFLGWRLPDSFAPDCYISFDRLLAKSGSWPIGTNLLTYDEAKQMLQYVLQGLKP